MAFNEFDAYCMNRCIELAEQAAALDEVPVGAVIVKNEEIIAEAYNLKESSRRALAHAELLAIDAASAELNAWRLLDCTLYVSLEPCAMCAGALINARIKRIVFATSDPKAGCVGSLMNLCADARFNHRPHVENGLFAEESSQLLKTFFRRKRVKST